MKRTVYTVLATIAAAITIAAAAAAAETAPQLWLNTNAPPISLPDQNGKKISLSGFKGKNTVLLAFWHPDNPFSVTQLQELQKILKADKKLSAIKVLAVTSGKEVAQRDAAKKKFADSKLDFTILFENRADTTAVPVQYQVAMVPAFIAVNKKGQIATPATSLVTENFGGKKYAALLADIDSGKMANGCMFVPSKDKKDDHSNHKHSKDKSPYDLIGKPVPGFVLADTKGVKQAPGYSKGYKNLIIVFWAPTCPHCRRELPQISAYYNKFASKQSVDVIAVALSDEAKMKDAARDFFKQFSIKYPLVFNEGDKIAPAFNVASVPTAIIVDKKGIVRDVYIGEASMIADVLSCQMDKMK